MEYIESNPFNESISEYNRYKIINLLSVFTNNNYMEYVMRYGLWKLVIY